jgi:hypothetical protein
MSPLTSLRRSQRPPRNQTRKEALPAVAAAGPADLEDGAAAAAASAPAAVSVSAVAWEEEFERDAALTATSHRDPAAFHPWDVSFSVISVSIPSFSRLRLPYASELGLNLLWDCSCDRTSKLSFFRLYVIPPFPDLMFELVVTSD